MDTYKTLRDTFHAEFLKRLSSLPRELSEEMRRLGYQLFLSDPLTARREGVLFCGLKPYGAAGRKYDYPVGLPAGFSTYFDESNNGPFYRTAREVITHYAEAGPATLCTNWFFYRAADTAQLKAFGLKLEDMYPYHRAIFDALRPQTIVCAGNGPFSAYAGYLGLLGLETEAVINGEGNSKVKIAKAEWGRVIGFPHFSRYGLKVLP